MLTYVPSVLAHKLHAPCRGIVTVGHNVIEHPHRALSQGNAEHLEVTVEWLGDAILDLATEVEAFCKRAVRIDAEWIRYLNGATLPSAL
jgi:hypothetical protein